MLSEATSRHLPESGRELPGGPDPGRPHPPGTAGVPEPPGVLAPRGAAAQGPPAQDPASDPPETGSEKMPSGSSKVLCTMELEIPSLASEPASWELTNPAVHERACGQFL